MLLFHKILTLMCDVMCYANQTDIRFLSHIIESPGPKRVNYRLESLSS